MPRRSGSDPVSPERSLHLSRILDGRRGLSGSFDPEGGAVIATALRLATTGDVDGEPTRSPAQRRAKLLPHNTLEVTDPQGHVHTSDPPTPHRPALPLRE